ncbi:two-component system sensor histidine kinase CreC [Pontiella sulfatireligans]|uniref:histidine kinase n=1 Tax=Pontiella sulfatireligans TaxID=2750658 RepID=A0A6C2URL4_9BACT|nr:two-component system sensor histidine kinase CreC [Pontiella sulfatireligans]VGO22593.1 Sensor protein CreC [Pontiella sulfatireligans]
MKIRNRLFITAALLMSIGVYWLVDWIVQDVRLHYFITMEESLVDTSVILAAQIAQQTDGRGIHIDPTFGKSISEAVARTLDAQIYGFTKTNMNLRVVVVDRERRVLYDSRGSDAEGTQYEWRDTRLALQGKYGARASYEEAGVPDSFHFYVAAPVWVDGEIAGAVSVGKPVSSITPFMRQARVRLVVSSLIAFTAILLLLIPVSLWIIHPIRILTDYARNIRDGRKVTRPVLGHGGEMSELANAFEEMRDALEGKQYVEEYVQSLTHEMKSPLAAIQGAAELLDEDMTPEQRALFLQNIRNESKRMHGLVDRMLALASIEKRKGLVRAEPVDVQGLLDDVAGGLAPVLQAKGITLRRSVVPGLELYGEYFLLRQAVMNLTQNAVDFSECGGVIELHAETAGTEIRIAVCDEGTGIPEYALDRIFDRFYSLSRPESGKKSSGLGLNFVRQIARLHGGDVVLANRPSGGVEATLSFPV